MYFVFQHLKKPGRFVPGQITGMEQQHAGYKVENRLIKKLWPAWYQCMFSFFGDNFGDNDDV